MKQFLILLWATLYISCQNAEEYRLEFKPGISFEIRDSNLEKEIEVGHLYVFPNEKYDIIYTDDTSHIITQKIDSIFTLTDQFIEYHSGISMLVIEPSFSDSNLYDCIYYPNKLDDGTFLLFENSTKKIQYK